MISDKKRNIYKYLAAYFLLWIILFEFFLPVNNILPKPSIVIQSFPSLVSDYNLLPNYISTVAVIYLALLLAYFTAKFIFIIPAKRHLTDFIWSLEWFSEYVPGVVLGIFLLFWFPATEYVEFLFAYLTVFFPILIRLQNARLKIPAEYILASQSLGLTEPEIEKRVKWKFGQSELLNKMGILHFNLWLVLIAFEFLKGGYGIGNVFQKALEYRDLSAFFSAAVITGLTIYIGNAAINFINTKINFWK